MFNRVRRELGANAATQSAANVLALWKKTTLEDATELCAVDTLGYDHMNNGRAFTGNTRFAFECLPRLPFAAIRLEHLYNRMARRGFFFIHFLSPFRRMNRNEIYRLAVILLHTFGVPRSLY